MAPAKDMLRPRVVLDRDAPTGPATPVPVATAVASGATLALIFSLLQEGGPANERCARCGNHNLRGTRLLINVSLNKFSHFWQKGSK